MNCKISFFILLLVLNYTTKKVLFLLISCNCQSLPHFNAASSRVGTLQQVRVANTLHFLKPSTTSILSDSLYALMGRTVGKEDLEELLQPNFVSSPLLVSISNWPSSCIY